MKNSNQLKSEKKIFIIVLTIMLVIVNAFTLYISFSDARTNVDLITSRVVNVINNDLQNNRSIASALGTMLQLPNDVVNKKLQIDINKLTNATEETFVDSDMPSWNADIDYGHRKKFTILRYFWRKFSDNNKSHFTTYYTDGDTGYYYLLDSEEAVKIHNDNPHFRLTGYIKDTSSILKKSHGFIVPEPFYSNVYEDSITRLPTITFGSPVVINSFTSQGSRISGIIATDYTRADLSSLFHKAFDELNLQTDGYDITIHSLQPNDIELNIFPAQRAWVGFNVKNVKLTNGFYLNASVHLHELIRIKLAGFIIANLIMLAFFLIFLKAHKNIALMMGKLTTDSLTQALSREGGKIVIDSLQNNKSTILVAMDLNDFKVINDTYGHHAGDQALVYFSDYFLKSVREEDHFIRMGGDEFVLLLQNTTITTARTIMDKLLHGLTEFPFEDKMVPLSFSYGVSEFACGFTDSYKRADEDLYLMKKQRKQSRR